MTNFSERLRHLMSCKKIDQAGFSKLTGFHKAQVSKWLAGLTDAPQRKTLFKVADYFGCDFEWLATGKGEPFPDKTLQAVDKWLANEDRAPSELAEHEREIAMERFVQKGKERLMSSDGELADPLLNQKLDDRSVNELLDDTKIVLDSDTVYRQALASNIRAFKQAVINEGKMKNTDEKIDQMMKQIEALTTIVLQGQAATETEKKRAGNGH